MAIEKMQKFNLIAFEQDQAAIMECLQDFQAVEFFSAEEYHSDTLPLFQQKQTDPQINEIEKQLSQVNGARNFLGPYLPRLGMIQALRKPIHHYTLPQLAEHAHTFDWQKACRQLKADEKRLRAIEQEQLEISDQEDQLNHWRYFDERPAILSTFKATVGLLGTVPNSEYDHLKQKMGQLHNSYLEKLHQTSTTTYLLFIYLKDEQRKVQNVLHSVAFEEYHYPYENKPAEDLKNIKEKAKNLAIEEKKIKQQLKEKQDLYEKLEMMAEYFDSLRDRLNSNQYLLESKYTIDVSGWIPVSKSKQLEKGIKNAVGSDYFLEFAEIKKEEYEEAPILLKNNKLVKPFEGLVEMYSLPQYGELDPTPFMMPFYALAFGLMVADFGYGLLLFLACFIGKRVLHFKEGMKQNINMFQICSVPTMMWGLVYGNIFGKQFSFQLLSTDSDITEILVMSVIFGFIQIMLGLGLKFYLLWCREKAKVKALFQAGSWILFLISAVMIVVGMLFVPETALQTVGIVSLIVSLVMVVIGGSFDGNTLIGKIGSGLYSFMDLTNYMSDLVSYTRLMALGVAGGSIGAAFNLIISYLPTPARFTVGIILFAALHGLNIFLSYLSAYVHGIRLQYLEFFGKFYTGGGRAFKPFKPKGSYVQVVSEQDEEED